MTFVFNHPFKFLSLLFSFILIMQGCGKNFQLNEQFLDSETLGSENQDNWDDIFDDRNPSVVGPEEGNVSNGQKLYKVNCSQCHGEINTSEKLNADFDRISFGFETVPQMSALQQRLTPTEVVDIVAALDIRRNLPPSGDLGIAQISRQPQSMGRYYISGMFKEIFQSKNFEGKNFDRTVELRLRQLPSIYGFPCNPYSTYTGMDCEDNVISSANMSLTPSSTVVRQLNKLSICEEVLHRTEALKAAAEKVDGLNQQELKPVTRDLIKKTFSLFYRNRPPEKAELDALEVFVKKLGIEPTNQWRGMLQIICEQPGWEAV